MSKGVYVIAFSRFLHCQILTLSNIQNRTHFGKYLHLAFVIALVFTGETLTNLMNKQMETIWNLWVKYFSVWHIFDKIHVQGRIAPVHTMRT